MLNTYVIEGGVGKAVAFSAIIPALVKMTGEPIQLFTSYVDVFSNNPNVRWVFDMDNTKISDNRITISDNILCPEPYRTNFAKGEMTLIESFCELCDVKYDKKMRPKLHTDYLKKEAFTIIDKIGGDFIVVQFNGGQPPVNYHPENCYNSVDPGRNYPNYLAEKVINQFKKENPRIAVINFALPNEPKYEGSLQVDASFGVWHELLKQSKGFISIDSSLNHLASSAGSEGVVLWGSTFMRQFSYPENTNLCFTKKQIDKNDPRNIMVDPFEVVKAINIKTKNTFKNDTLGYQSVCKAM